MNKQHFLLSTTIFLALFISCEEPKIDHDISIPIDEAYAAYFPVGTALAVGEYSYNSLSDYDDELLSIFNSYVAENCMKPSVLQPTPGSFQWSFADDLVDFANDQGALLRGHTLLWHSQSPEWMADGTKAQVREKIRNHINAVVGRYMNDVYAWDVVNEAVLPDGYRTDSMWYRAYGDETFIRDAFEFAHAADPDAQLFYNDYSVANPSPAKLNQILAMINDLSLKDYGLTGVGMQAHWGLSSPSISDIDRTIKAIGAEGLEVHITELDINTYGEAWNDDLDQRLADRYASIFEVFRNNSDIVTNVIIWGIADDHTWLDNTSGNTKKYPLLFDTERKAKAAYHAVVNF